MSTAGRWRIRK